jgi:hypothetical protein
MMQDVHKSYFVNEWIEKNLDILSKMHPNIPEEQIVGFLRSQVDKHIEVRTGYIHNNYNHKQTSVDLLKVIDWYHDKKPILAGNGCFYKNQNQEPNPAAKMQENFMNLRKEYKKKMYTFKSGTYEFATFKRLQNGEKVNVNSWYGVSGLKTSAFYNVYTAQSTTSTGQSLISTTTFALEGFVGDNFKFIDLNECLCYTENIVKSKRKLDDGFLESITVEQLFDRLKKHFYEYKDEYEEPLLIYLYSLKKKDIARIYYKNNLYKFSYLPEVRKLLSHIFRKTEDFKDPSNIPENIKDDLKELWKYYKEFVYYRGFYFNRIQRLKEDRRNNVPIIDTDSNFLNLNPWYEFIDSFIVGVSDNLMARDKDTIKYMVINTMSTLVSFMLEDLIWAYGKNSNILKDFRKRLNMKNEYMFHRIILYDGKKAYISSILLKEGHVVDPPEIDIKGFAFIKSTTREDTKEFFEKVVENRLINVDKINIPDILRDLEFFEGAVRESLEKGEKKFLIPKSVKEVDAYKDPYREQGMRAVIAWNAIAVDNPIELPSKTDIIKVNMCTLEDCEKLETTHPEIYKSIKDKIFGNKVDKIAKKGIEVIAIPRNVTSIPEWLLPYIDYDTIVNDNASRFFGVLESLGIEILENSKNRTFSNLIKV